MPVRPELPDRYELPEAVNAWTHDPASGKNAHVWTNPDHEVSVAVFHGLDTVRVAVFDDRVDGFENTVEVYNESVPRDAPRGGVPRYVAAGVDAAVEWMEANEPGEWTHPDVEPAVFNPPAGYVLDRYYLEKREHIVYYRQEGTESGVEMAGRRLDTEPSLDTRRYLYVQAWRGSGNATVALAPWRRAHDHEIHEIVDTPEECGLDVAVMLAREWIADQRGPDADAPRVSQSSIDGGSA